MSALTFGGMIVSHLGVWGVIFPPIWSHSPDLCKLAVKQIAARPSNLAHDLSIHTGWEKTRVNLFAETHSPEILIAGKTLGRFDLMQPTKIIITVFFFLPPLLSIMLFFSLEKGEKKRRYLAYVFPAMLLKEEASAKKKKRKKKSAQ